MIEILGIKYITDKEASTRYGYSTSWFQKQRHKNLPPPFVKINEGKIYYSIEELDSWFKSKIIRY